MHTTQTLVCIMCTTVNVYKDKPNTSKWHTNIIKAPSLNIHQLHKGPAIIR